MTYMESPSMREASLQRVWIGRPYQELVGAWGAPKMILLIPGDHRPEEMVAVYSVGNAALGCVDAFTVHNGTTQLPNEKSEIINYFCR